MCVRCVCVRCVCVRCVCVCHCLCQECEPVSATHLLMEVEVMIMSRLTIYGGGCGLFGFHDYQTPVHTV